MQLSRMRSCFTCSQRCRPAPVSATARALRSKEVPPALHEEGSRAFANAAFGVVTAAAVTLASLALQFAPPAEAKLTSGDPIKNASAILRYALPVDSKKPIRQLQGELESISAALRIPGSKSLDPVARYVRSARDILLRNRDAMIADFAPEKKEKGLAALNSLDQSLVDFQKLIDAKDKQEVPIKQREVLNYVGLVEEAMVKGFPFQVPPEYSKRPLLLMKVKCKDTPEGPQTAVLTIVLDGYNAPVSAGQFMDLVEKGFYNGMEIQRQDGFVVQTGDPEGPDEGYRDPATGEIRTVPIEIRVQGDTAPIYDFNLEDLGRVNEQPVLPFNAYGTLAWARNEFDNNSASSQVFFLLRESELTPSGSNLLDGRFAVFGYVVEGQDYLGVMKVGDTIEEIKVLDGAENLKTA